jgi:CubicO group peptidase (beta-lactamase class C family)
VTSRFERARDLLRAAHDAGRFSGAAVLAAVDGATVLEEYLGDQAAWSDAFEPIEPADRVPVSADTLFDLASVTKTFTAHTALSVVDAGDAELDVPIAEALPSYRAPMRERVTLRHLLAHTSGLPAEWTGWRTPLQKRLASAPEPERVTTTPLAGDRDALVGDLLATPLEAPPGAGFVYSCAGYNTTMVYLERVTGEEWPELLRRRTTGPLGLASVTASPDRDRAAATEFQPQFRRGVIRGDVHDEAAWSLGGHSANAGLFATGRDLLVFGEAVRRGEGRVRGEWMWDGLGLRIGDPEWGAASPEARTHVGFTGTLLHLDRASASTIVLLTNRVHPSREQEIADLRRDVVDAILAAAA